jgi:hypothetical protein
VAGVSSLVPWEALDPEEWLAAPWAEADDVEQAEPWGTSGDGEAEIFPLLAALLPAVISAAPAIISSISSAFAKPAAPTPARPAPAAAPRPLPPPPARTSPAPARAPAAAAVAAPRTAVPAAGTPAPGQPAPPAAAPPPSGLEAQIAALLPGIVTLVAGALSQSESSPTDDEASEDCPACGESGADELSAEDAAPAGEPSPASTLVPMPDRSSINIGVHPCPTHLLVSRHGSPREELTDRCQATTSPFWSDRMVTESVGPFRVRGHRKAVAVLRDAFAALRTTDPDLYGRIGTVGMLCVRHVRGRPGVLSNHALGMAIDLTIDGVLDTRGDDRVQRGLVTVHDVFTRFGIYWGAGFRTEDAMHFEMGADLVNAWLAEGSI